MHLDEWTIACYLDGAVDDARRAQVEAHLADCPVCRRAVVSGHRMLQAVAHDAAIVPDPEALRGARRRVMPERPRRAPRRVPPMRVALAAVVLVGVSLAAYFGVAPDALERFRGAAKAEAFTARYPADGAHVGAAALTFSWTPLPTATRYRVAVYTEAGTVVWEGDAKADRLALPPTATLAPGATYLWGVDALLADGTTRSTPLYAFTAAR